MFKLTVVAGPNRGTSFPVQDGENSIGRQAGNSVVLPSAKVSKKHCVLVVSDGQVIVQDQGSSNGTFVNGELSKSKPVKAGDRISVGEYVLELSEPASRPSRPAPAFGGLPVGRGSNVLQFPSTAMGGGAQIIGGAAAGAGLPGADGASAIPAGKAPQDLKGKLLHAFEHSLMPVFYGLNLKHEWHVLCAAALGAFAAGNLLISVSPLLEQNRQNVVKEVGKRASFMARQIAERNAPALAARAETKTEVGSIETAEGVRVAVLTDLDSRILAPGTKLNQYLSAGPEAAFATRAREQYRAGKEGGFLREVDGLVIAVEPVRIASQVAGRNMTAGMAVVSIDTALSTPDLGEMGMVYSEALVLTLLLGGAIFLILYKLTLKPLQQLNDDMDKALKGELGQVTHEFKFTELDSLWDLINSALQRIPKGGSGDGGMGGFGGGSGGGGAEDMSAAIRMIGAAGKFGLVLLDADRKIVSMNPVFEEMSGIRSDNSLGQDLASVARDQSLAPFANDLMDRASSGMDTSEDYDFSGIAYRCHVAALGAPAKGYVLLLARTEG